MLGFIFLFFAVAQAEFLKIQGEPSIQLIENDKRLHLSGEYSISNGGDEIAYHVFPVLGVDRYRWTGSAHNIGPGETHSWKIEDDVHSSKLCFERGLDCQEALPAKGRFLIRVEKHYQDQNGFQFVVPDAFIISHHPKTEPRLEMKIEVQAEKKDIFTVSYFLENLGSDDFRISLRPLLPQEVKLITAKVPLEIKPSSKLQGHFQFVNKRGLPGSQYIAFLVAEWAQGSERQSLIRYESFKIPSATSQRASSSRFVFWVWLLLGTFLGLIGMWIFWIRPIQKMTSSGSLSQIEIQPKAPHQKSRSGR